MASSPRSVTSTFRPPVERSVVSGLGISSESEGSEVRGPRAEAETQPVPAPPSAPWVQPPPSKKELWRKLHALGEQSSDPGCASGRPAVSPEMRGKCFRCLEKGHFRVDCINEIVCFRCGLPGHGSRDCKRPRSPSSVDELRRDTVAKVARRASPVPPAAARGTPPVAPPPPPPQQRTSQDAHLVWLPLAPLRLQTVIDAEEDPTEICIVRRSQTVEDLERRLQFSMVAYVGGARPVIPAAQVHEVLAGKLDIPPDLVSVHRHRPKDFLVVFASAELRNRVSACPIVAFEGDRLFFRPWNRQSQAVHAMFGFKVWLEIEGIPPHAWDRSVVEELLGSSCKVDSVAPETCSRADLSSFKLSAWTAHPQGIPTLRWLVVPEPGEEAPPALL
ncbi:hypothetical protein VPH35_018555 [Triticum aestivum]